MTAARESLPAGHSGIGTTLSANALATAAMRAMLEQVMTEAAYTHMVGLAGQLVQGLNSVISRHALPWHVTNVGARVELICAPVPPRNGTEARNAMDYELEALLHLMLVNRGILLAPFHNMMLVSPATTVDQVDRLIRRIDDSVAIILNKNGTSI